jgi:membrane peptidoglycan carboxypeptidase
MKKIIGKLILLILTIILVMGLVLGGTGYIYYKEALKEIPLDEKVAGIREDENFCKYDELPKIYVNAVIAAEDKRFYMHKGIDPISLGRAIVNDIKAMSFVEGGSTITQQFAKNAYFTQKKQMIRKVSEAFMAIEIEKHYEKNEILELYLNTSYFGDGCYTVKEASIHYFGKDPMEMTDYEATLLAGVPNAPSVYAPTKNLDLAHKRQKQVLNKMIECGYLTDAEAQQIENEASKKIQEENM